MGLLDLTVALGLIHAGHVCPLFAAAMNAFQTWQ